MIGIIPYDMKNTRIRLSKMLCCAIGTFITFYWTSMIICIVTKTYGNDRISRISNYFQLISNAIMLTTLLISPVFKLKIFAEIVHMLKKFEDELSKDSIHPNYTLQMRWNIGIIIGVIGLLMSITSFDCYVTVFNGFVTFEYWLITIFPHVVNVITVIQPITLLSYANTRFRILNELLMLEQNPMTDLKKQPLKARATTCFTRSSKQNLHVVEFYGYCHNKYFWLPRILYRYNDLYEICKLLNKYFGLLFLLTFTSIFIVTTIQLYYSYTILYWFTGKNGFTIWSLLVCFNTIAMNLAVLLAIVLLCESISNKSKIANDLVADLQLRGSRQMSSEEIIKITTPFQTANKTFKFSAMGFFFVDCNMLCGMIGAITTYLVIYIQFYILYADEVKKSIFVARFSEGSSDTKH
ncbi:gustatory and pheromone receptor 32a-like [Uranotaenia lowii]|uniref:gustatory and pheromone receptor 32a-like n=1 Tax=Uranotaenia lowii TaxID=190385 RepID=UPI0024791400|nr:gustatory and pheromone receptor 32a-like [Uranotaenia lowii]